MWLFAQSLHNTGEKMGTLHGINPTTFGLTQVACLMGSLCRGEEDQVRRLHRRLGAEACLKRAGRRKKP